MVQYLRPESDNPSDPGTWTVSPFWSKIDEVTPNDSDEITSPENPVGINDFAAVILTSPTFPTDTSGWVLRVRAKSTTVASDFPVITLSNSTSGFGYFDFTDTLTTDYKTYEFAISESQAQFFIDNDDGTMQVFISQSWTSGSGKMSVSWLEVEMPDAPSGGPTTPSKKKLKKIIRLQNKIIHRLLRNLRNCDQNCELPEAYQELLDSGLLSVQDCEGKQDNPSGLVLASAMDINRRLKSQVRSKSIKARGSKSSLVSRKKPNAP